MKKIKNMKKLTLLLAFLVYGLFSYAQTDTIIKPDCSSNMGILVDEIYFNDTNLENRINDVKVDLYDTVRIETAIGVSYGDTTVSRPAYYTQRQVDSVGVISVAVADTTLSSPAYYTQRQADSAISASSSGGSATNQLKFIVGTTVNAPTAGVDTLQNAAFYNNKHLEAWKTNNGVTTHFYNIPITNDSTANFSKVWVDGDSVVIDVTDEAAWSYIVLTDTTPSGGGTEVASDDFDGRSNATLGGQGLWVTIYRLGSIVVGTTDKYIHGNEGGEMGVTSYNAVFEDDQYSQATLEGFVSTEILGVGTRLSGSEGTLTGYGGWSSSTFSQIFRITNGGRNIIATGDPFLADEVIRLESIGTSHYIYRDGVLDTSFDVNPVVDATYSSGDAGVITYNIQDGQLDNWSAGNIP